MAAPDLKTLFQQEEQLNACLVGALDGVLGASAPSFYAHDTRERPADYNAVVTELGAATGHVAGNGDWDVWNFRLRVTVVTERKQEEPTPIRHAAQKGAVRATLSVLSGKLTQTATAGSLPYLQINLLRPDNTTVDFQNIQQRMQDITVLEYVGTVAVRYNAWP